MSKRVSFKVHGRVQGVNFRSFTQSKAENYGLTGFVENTPNDKVEGEAQGSEDALQKFLKDINDGPRAAHVVKVEKKEVDVVQGESSFVAK